MKDQQTDLSPSETAQGAPQWMRWIEDGLDEAADIARQVAEEFYEVVERANERAKQQGGEINKTSVRVRRRQNSLYIEWIHFYWYRGGDGSLKRTVKSIRKGKGKHKYPLQSLIRRSPDPRVQEAIGEAEAQFAVLREQARSLVEARKALQRAEEARSRIAELASKNGSDDASNTLELEDDGYE